MIAANAAPLKHCPPPMRGNSQRRWTDYQTPPDSRKCLGVLIHRQRRFLLLSTALPVFVFWSQPLRQRLRAATARVAAPSIRSALLASCWPRPQQRLPVSATGGGRRCCPYRGEPLAKRQSFTKCQGLSSIGEVAM